ncbi:hypothetical protein LSUB1_G007777 [Lachnellula subtilissima]|uniref:Uncharacterized protein n=1 Tax=Lachnellula subtilissima TaxID=602034 RepID=A0A8H8RBZ2_9HELO|nr:hypothetical protein LSUB1_G007777 [Lachnellula subtilissima]
MRDPQGGPYKILLEFTYEFTKQFLGAKEIPHVFLLGLIFADNAFLAPNLTSAEQLSKLDIRPGTNQLALPLKPSMANIPLFRKSITTPYSTEISPFEPLPYTTLRSLLKTLDILFGLLHILRAYCLRYGAGNAFNQSGHSRYGGYRARARALIRADAGSVQDESLDTPGPTLRANGRGDPIC